MSTPTSSSDSGFDSSAPASPGDADEAPLKFEADEDFFGGASPVASSAASVTGMKRELSCDSLLCTTSASCSPLASPPSTVVATTDAQAETQPVVKKARSPEERKLARLHKMKREKMKAVVEDSDDDLLNEARCTWNNCGTLFLTDNDLFDHVIEHHIEILRPCDEEATTSTADSGVSSLRSSRGASPSSSSNTSDSASNVKKEEEKKEKKENEEEEEELSKFACRWLGCDMSCSRGDRKKQYAWLEEHYRSRHSRGAQPFKCLLEGCTMRFTKKRTLDVHLRNGHEAPKQPRSRRKDLKRVAPCWYAFHISPYRTPMEYRHQPYDQHVDESVYYRLHRMNKLGSYKFVANRPEKKESGAAWRKRPFLLTWDIQPCEEEDEKMDISESLEHSEKFDAEAESQLSFADLFPDPNAVIATSTTIADLA